VKVGLLDAAAVGAGYREIADALGRSDPLVLVQPMATGNVELVAGIVHEQLFGSLVMAGLGGVPTDLFADRVFRLVPMTDRDAGRM
jgi:acyl-CoA synthetase (NDP forming)